MSKISIGIVEDESIIADDLRALLEDIGYQCPEPCANYNEAVGMLYEDAPDLVLLDINLGGKPDGIRIGKFIREKMSIPFIFLTANSDPETVTAARETHPNAYLVKPFQKGDLYAAIEVALYNFNSSKKQTTPSTDKKLLNNSLFIKDGDYFYKVHFDEILYLSSEHVYVTVHTTKRKYLVRTSMHEYLDHFDPSQFIKVHRSYIVNLNWIEKINSNSIFVSGNELPLSKNYRDELLRILNLG
jgi:DNA-binding LytR/AlgR family response regulator